jgi:D-amino-acid dehydrogenase
MSEVIIAGGGIIGLCSAYYLVRDGHSVTVIDKSDMTDNCSYGNAGYVCPSHFVPLASPGNVKLGLRWMTRSDSPFYIQPRFDPQLFNWGYHFVKSATKEHVKKSAVPLRDIAIFSKELYEILSVEQSFDFHFQKKGMLEFFKTEANRHHEAEMADISHDLGLEARLLTREEVSMMEPNVDLDILGALYFDCDAHLYPNHLMQNLLSWLPTQGVRLIKNETVQDFILSGKKIIGVKTQNATYNADQFVLAAGSWSGRLASAMGLKIPLVGGRGYSVTIHDTPYKLNSPVILTEARIALTPLDENTLRIGGTMEITSLTAPPKMHRVEAILNGVRNYFPQFELSLPAEDHVWFGYRPCSADGLPYIGRVKKFDNLVIATGHAMIGLSLGAGTGKLVSELIGEIKTSVDLKPFDPERFN